MKTKILIIMMLALLQYPSFSQDQHLVDSLQTLYKTTKQDTTRADILYELSRAFCGNNPDKAIDYAKQTLALSEQIGYKKGIGNAYNSMGIIKEGMGDYTSAMEFYENSLEIRTEIGNKQGIADSKNNIGIIYCLQSNYPEALKNYFDALKIRIEIGDMLRVAGSYNNIGVIYQNQGNYPEALKNFFAALKIKEENKDKKGIANAYSNIGYAFRCQGNYQEAVKYNFAALKIREEIGDKYGIGMSYSNIGTNYSDQGNYPEALKNYFAALKIREEIGDKRGIAGSNNDIGVIYSTLGNKSEALKNHFACLNILEEIGDKYGIGNSCINIGKIYTTQEKYKDASQYLNKGLSLSKEIGSLANIKDCYGGLTELYIAQGNFKQALEHYKLHIATRDSLVNEQNTKKITQQQMQFEFDKKEALTKAEQEKKDALAQEELQKQKLIRNGFVVGLAMLLILLFLIYRNYSKQRKANKALDISNHKLDDSIKSLEKTNHVLKETQQQLVHQEKLASLGALTAGIAHEIKNPLNFVNNFAELSNELLEELETAKDEEERNELMLTIRQNLLKINEHGKRADGIVKSMLEHSRSGLATKQPTDLNKICEEYVNLAYHGKRATVKDFNCTIEKQFSPGLPQIYVVSQDISRVILNLVNNAFDAMKDKTDARLEISTDPIHQPFEGVKIIIRDNGEGMSEAVQQKIFEPFFTTKPSGQGTGLGLSLSFDIIKSHGGQIEVHSEEEIGTEFIIILPV